MALTLWVLLAVGAVAAAPAMADGSGDTSSLGARPEGMDADLIIKDIQVGAFECEME